MRHRDKNWNWHRLLKNPPSNHIQNECDTKMKNILLTAIHKQFIANNETCDTDFEHILADCYMLSFIAKY